MDLGARATCLEWETIGTYLQAGTARFYTGATPTATTVFSAGDTSNPAHGLAWSKGDPTGHLPAAASAGYVHGVSVTWNGMASQTLLWTNGTQSGSQTATATI